MSLVLEVGKYYARADGSVVGPLQKNPDRSSAYAYGVPPSSGGDIWQVDGRFYTIPNQNDLVREVSGPQPAAPAAPAATTGLSLAVGRYYAQASGNVVGPIQANPNKSSIYKFGIPPFGNTELWRVTGQYLNSSLNPSHPLDLIREVPGPAAAPATLAVPPASDEQVPEGPPIPDRPPIPIDKMGLDDYRRGVAAVHASFRIRTP